MTKKGSTHKTVTTYATPAPTGDELRQRLILIGVGLAGALTLALLGGIVYWLFTATLSTLRWWAGLATVGAALLPFLGYFLGTSTSRAHQEGLAAGVQTAQDIMQTGVATTMRAAADTAEVRITTAHALRPPVAAGKLTLDELNRLVRTLPSTMADGERYQG